MVFTITPEWHNAAPLHDVSESIQQIACETPRTPSIRPTCAWMACNITPCAPVVETYHKRKAREEHVTRQPLKKRHSYTQPSAEISNTDPSLSFVSISGSADPATFMAPWDCRSPSIIRTPSLTPTSNVSKCSASDIPPSAASSLSSSSMTTTGSFDSLSSVDVSFSNCEGSLHSVEQLLQAERLRRPDVASLFTKTRRKTLSQQRREWVAWMLQLNRKLPIHPETVYTAVAFVDRYVSRNRMTQRKQWHHLAMASLYVAAKWEEDVYEPVCTDMIAHALFPTTVDSLRRMERKVLDALQWEPQTVTPYKLVFAFWNFLPWHVLFDSSASPSQEWVLEQVQAFMEVVLLELDFVVYLPSVITSAMLSLVAQKMGGDEGMYRFLDALVSLSLDDVPLDTRRSQIVDCITTFQQHCLRYREEQRAQKKEL